MVSHPGLNPGTDTFLPFDLEPVNPPEPLFSYKMGSLMSALPTSRCGAVGEGFNIRQRVLCNLQGTRQIYAAINNKSAIFCFLPVCCYIMRTYFVPDSVLSVLHTLYRLILTPSL